MTGQDSKEEKGKWQQFAEKNNEVEETAEERLPDGVAASEGDEIVDDGLDLDVNLDLDEGLVADMRAADELSNQVKSLEMKIAS